MDNKTAKPRELTGSELHAVVGGCRRHRVISRKFSATAANRPARAPARSPSIHSESANEVRSIGSTACSIISLHTVGETVSWNLGSMHYATKPKQSARWRNIAFRRLLHQRQSVTVGIAEKCHPQIVIVHGSNQMR